MTTEDRRAWVGCLACYNAGRLTGEWFDAADCADVTPDDIHEGPTTHEELWVMDHEGLYVTGEMSPAEAARIAALLDSAEGDGIPAGAFAAYADDMHGGLSHADEDTVTDFRDVYQGEYDSREDFAQELADELGAIPADYSWPASYIDWERAARDLFMDYSDAPAPGGRIYVWRQA